MAQKSEFADFVLELLAPLGHVSGKRMFGGWGIYRDGLMFALIAEETLYLKTDEQNRGEFEAEGLEPFRYLQRGKPVTFSYHRAPDAALDSPQAMRPWAESAFGAALRARKLKRR